MEGTLTCYADDFVWVVTVNFINKVADVTFAKLTSAISWEEHETFKHLGLYVNQNDKGIIEIQQIPYIDELKEYFIKKSQHELPNAQLTGKQVQQLWAIAGQLNWTSSQTRPDISYQGSEISASVKDVTITN